MNTEATLSALQQFAKANEGVIVTELKPVRLRNAPAAEYLGMTPRALDTLRFRKGGPRYHRGGTAHNSPVYYFVADLDAWMAEQSEQAPQIER